MSGARRRLRRLCHVGGLALALGSAAWPAPAAAPDRDQRLVVALDVSMSMRAADVAPDRLGEARRQLLDFVAAAAPARAGVLVFAGDARVICPLTSDLAAVREALGTAAPGDAAGGGSDLAAALERAAAVARAGDRLVIVTDGEAGPGGESDPLSAATRLREQGIAVTVVGVGSASGAPVPSRAAAPGDADSSAEPHRSRLDDVRLRRVADAAGGRYQTLDAGGRLDLVASPPVTPGGPIGVGPAVVAAFLLLLAEATLWWLPAESNPWP